MKYTYILLLETSQESQGHFQEISISFQLEPKVTWQDEPNKHCFPGLLTISNSIRSCFFRGQGYPGLRGFSWFFLAKEINSKPRSGDNESRKRRGEREKPLVTLTSNLTSMQTTAVKRVKLLIKRVTNGNLANTCLSAAIFLSGGRPGEIMLWTNHLHLGGKEWFVNRGQAKACVNDGRQESRNKKTTL